MSRELFPGNTSVVGLQWGDEGKGKIVDFLAQDADAVVRYCGGANAGHTVRIGSEKYATHLLPVGIFRAGVMNFICNGVVIDPVVLFKEIDEFVGRGVAVSCENLRISYKAHLVMPWHVAEDVAREARSALGTTKRGIGPAYADKMQRTTAIRVADLLHEDKLREKIEQIAREKNELLKLLYDAPPIDARKTFEQYRDAGKRIAPLVDDTGQLIIQMWKAGKRILYEGAHAVLLDVDHGTYPFVTSSNCSSLGLFTGAGVPPRACDNFVGIMKAYSTRVGAGPFPTEQDNKTGNYIRERGNEYGTTTKRPRRCGWFDALAVKYAAELCGITHVALMLLDVLSGLDHLDICTGYKHRGKRLEFYNADAATLAECEPIFETLPSWRDDISQCRRFEELPREAQQYVKRLETLVDAPIKMISVGPDRAATIVR